MARVWCCCCHVRDETREILTGAALDFDEILPRKEDCGERLARTHLRFIEISLQLLNKDIDCTYLGRVSAGIASFSPCHS